MKKILAWMLALAMLLGMAGAAAEEAGKYDSLTVAVTTGFSGNFLSATLGNNSSDLDIRRLIHGYSLVNWQSDAGVYQFDTRVVSAAVISENGLSFTLALNPNLTWSDGTPITARDYAFSMLLMGSREMLEVCGAREDLSRILGGKAWQDGEAQTLAGLRVLGEHQLTLTLDPSYGTYFYQLYALNLNPLPLALLAPDCDVKDDGQGAYIDGPFTGKLLQETLLNPETGYISHPSLTCGPYRFVSYDGTTVVLETNEYYMGNQDGLKPAISRLVIQAEDPDTVIGKLASGEVDLVTRCARADQIQGGMSLTTGGDYGMRAYSRAGLSFISFCAEKGPTEKLLVRRGIAMCMDKATLTTLTAGAFGTPVDGFYGIGQWMFMLSNGTLLLNEETESGETVNTAEDLSLEKIQIYDLDPERAARLFDQCGWSLNEKGEAYDASRDSLRYSMAGGSLTPLKLKLIYPEGNAAADHLQECFGTYLAQAGAELEIEALPMDQLLLKYYGREERDCDMILLGTNFGDVFDPTGEYDEEGTSRLTGVTDIGLKELAESMRTTVPGDPVEYCRRWLDWQQRLTTVNAVLPLYSNAYLDFHVITLQNYEPGRTGSWSLAIPEAYLGDYAAETETEDEDEFDFD